MVTLFFASQPQDKYCLVLHLLHDSHKMKLASMLLLTKHFCYCCLFLDSACWIEHEQRVQSSVHLTVLRNTYNPFAFVKMCCNVTTRVTKALMLKFFFECWTSWLKHKQRQFPLCSTALRSHATLYLNISYKRNAIQCYC